MNTRYTTVNLDVSQQGSIPSITLSQYDLGVGLGFYIMDGGVPYSEFAETDTVVLSGTKPSGTGFTVPAYYKSGNLCSFRTPQAMTTEAGTVTCEITITKVNNISVSTANFFVEVEASAHAHEIVDEDIEDFSLIADQVGEYKATAVRAAQQAAQSATDAAASAGSAEESMEAAQSAASSAIAAKDDIQEYIDDSEAWALGTRGGVAVPSTDGTYHNNSKYYAEKSGQDAEAWAKGTRGGTAVPSTDPTYQNNAKYYAEQSSEASMAAGSSATEAAASAQEAAATLAGAIKPATIDAEFNASTAYAVGDTVVHEGRLYEFTSAHAAGAWNASHVTAISVMDEVSDLKGDLNEYVQYNALQGKLDSQKLIARTNIGAERSLGVEDKENLFDSSAITLDKSFFASDTPMTFLRDMVGKFASDPIDVIGCKEIVVNDVVVIAQYDKDGNVITPTLQPQNSVPNEIKYTLGESVRYIRVCSEANRLDTVYVRKCGFTIPNLRLTPLQRDIHNGLYGSKLSIIGDSIESFDDHEYRIYYNFNMYYPRGSVQSVEQMWWKKVADVSGMVIDVNASFSGARASKTAPGDVPSFYDRTSIIGSPDAIIVALGTNDDYYNVELGEYDFTTEYENLPETTFRPSYIKGIKALKALYPNAQIICIIMKMGDAFKESIKTIAVTLGVPFIDASDYRGEGGVHPGAVGMEQIASLILHPTDESLTQKHIPADAKKVGEELADIRQSVGGGNVSYLETQILTEEQKTTARNNIGAQENNIKITYSNIFDSNDVLANKTIFPSDGQTHTREGWNASGFINIEGLSEITISNVRIIAFYDSNQALIPETGKDLYNRYKLRVGTYAVPSGASYLRVALDTTININDVLISNGYYELPQLASTSEYVTPEMFGAVGDGVTDDSNAFALAIADGRPVKLLGKRYKTNLSITRSNVNISGVRAVTEIVPALYDRAIISVGNENASTTDDLVRYVTITDLIVYGEFHTVVGLRVIACQNCWFERIHFERCYSGAVLFEGVWDTKLRDCDAWICGNKGMEGADDGLNKYSLDIKGNTFMKSNALVIDGCRFEHSPRFLNITSSFQILITNCKFEGHTRAYGNDAEYSPIRVRGAIKGLHFVNDIFTYNSMLNDGASQEVPLFNNGIPFITVSTDATTAVGEKITVIANCQFATQPNFAVAYFSGNETVITGCNFDKCTGEAVVIELKDYCTLSDCDMVILKTGTAVKVNGAYTIVDNLRIFDANENTSKSIVEVTDNATRGYAKVLYNGTDRSNLATAGTGGFGIDVEFVGLRKYDRGQN